VISLITLVYSRDIANTINVIHTNGEQYFSSSLKCLSESRDSVVHVYAHSINNDEFIC
jgi:hypothetical protein